MFLQVAKLKPRLRISKIPGGITHAPRLLPAACLYVQIYNKQRQHHEITPERQIQRPALPKMLYLAFAVLTAFLAITSAHNIQMKAHSRECFHEQLHKDDKMTVTFQVGDREFGGSGNLELDFWVRGDFLSIPQSSDFLICESAGR